MFLENYTKFLKYFGKGRGKSFFCFGVLSMVAGFMELFGVALIYPFVMFIVDPMTVIQKFPILNHLDINITNSTNFGLLIGLLVLLIFILKNFFMLYIQYFQTSFVKKWIQDIVTKFMEYYLYAPYKDVMQTSQGDKLYVVEYVCAAAVNGFVLRGLTLIINAVIITMIIGLLFWKFPIAAIATIVFATVSMTLQNKFLKQRILSLSKVVNSINKKYKAILIESMVNLKEVKILCAEKLFINGYLKNANQIITSTTKLDFFNSIPPYIVEMLMVASLLVLACVISLQNKGSNSSLIASLAIVIAALFRVAPALNRIQTSIININSSRVYVKQLNEQFEKYRFASFKKYEYPTTDRLDFRHAVELKNICFSYNKDKQVLKNVSLKIEKGDFVGVIGLSGAGKSTLADVLTGLLPADSGEICVDGLKLTEENYPKFRRLIGYVPQQINILDKSIKENVAWGCETIDDEKVVSALKAAQLYDVIKNYPDGINSNIFVGANGLSQGQKQRLAIARAIYREPEIIIFDEATSSLDVQVEHEITAMLAQISKSKTILAIAHRLSTLKSCNKLIYMKDGEIVDIGTFEELSSRYAEFEKLVKLSSIS